MILVPALPRCLQRVKMVLISVCIFVPSFKCVLKSLPRRSLLVELGAALIKYLRRTHQLQRCDLELVILFPAPDFR